MKDARRRAREVVDKFFPVHHRDSGELIGYLTDVTTEGGMIQSNEPQTEGSLLPLRIELEEPIEGTRQIDLEGRCVWTRKDRNAVFHYTGFQFTNVSESQRERIRELAERYRLTISE